MQAICSTRRILARPKLVSGLHSCSGYGPMVPRQLTLLPHLTRSSGFTPYTTKFLSSVSGNTQGSTRAKSQQLLCRLAPGLWVYNNGGLYGGEAAVAVNQTTQQVVMMQKNSASVLSQLPAHSSKAGRRGVHEMMGKLSQRVVKKTTDILQQPQLPAFRKTLKRTSGSGTLLLTTTESLGLQSSRCMPQHHHHPMSTSARKAAHAPPPSSTSAFTQTTSPKCPSVLKATLKPAYRTQVAPAHVRPPQASMRFYSTGITKAKPPQTALVKYEPHSGPLDRIGRAKLLSEAPTLWARTKIRLKLLLMRQIRPWRLDDFIAMFSWAFLANVMFVLLGTTTFFSLVLSTANSLQFQGFVASKISDYMTASTGVKVKFDSAIVPNWKDGRITLRNVVMSKRAEEPRAGFEDHRGEDHSGHRHEHDREHHEHSQEEIDTNFTMFDLTIDQIDITLSAKRWLDGKGLIEDAFIKGVRGVIDRSNVWWDPEIEYIPEESRRKHVPGDFELESFALDDMLVTVLQPDGFRPYTVSIFSAQLPQLRKQWLCYDMLCADSMVGMFDGCLFSCYTAQRENTEYQTDAKWKRTTRFKIDDVKIDHLNAGVEGPFGWITSGTVDVTCDVRIPNAPNDDVLSRLVNDIVDKIDEVVDFAPLPLVFGTGTVGGKEVVVYPNRAAAALHRKRMEEEELEQQHQLYLQENSQHQSSASASIDSSASSSASSSSASIQSPSLHSSAPDTTTTRASSVPYSSLSPEAQHQALQHQLQQQQQQQQNASQHSTKTASSKRKVKKPALVMDFEFRFNDCKASIPLHTESMSYLSNAMIRPIVAFMNSNRTTTPIRCRVEMDLSEFDGSWTVYDSNLMNNVSAGVGIAWANLVADERERNRKLKRVGLWGLQSMTRNIVNVFDYARGNRGFWHYIGTQPA